LGVTVTGGGSVSDNGNSAKISNCSATGGACSASYNANTTVNLTASPPTGVTWGDACSSTGSVTMNSAKTCTAKFASGGGTPTGPVQPVVSGNRLIDSRTGNTWIPHGANVPSLEYACTWNYNPDGNDQPTNSIPTAATWGMDVIRLPLNENCWLGTNHLPNYGTPASYQSQIQTWVTRAHNAGMVVILDLHWSAPPGTAFNPPRNQWPMADSQSVTFWSQVAAAYKNDPSVMFDLFNEPYMDRQSGCSSSASKWKYWRDGGCNATDADESSKSSATYPIAGMAAMVKAVRDAGAKQPILLAGLAYANDLSGWLANKPDDSQLVASWHNYQGQGCNPISTCAASVQAQVPVIMTEVGWEAGSPGYFENMLTSADSAGMGYLPWAWVIPDSSPSDPYYLFYDKNFTPSNGSGKFSRNDSNEGAVYKQHLKNLGLAP
jgi:hypothetical protein